MRIPGGDDLKKQVKVKSKMKTNGIPHYWRYFLVSCNNELSLQKVF
jgi:hypothetical protein